MASYTVSQADVDARVIENTATADSDQTDPVEDSASLPVARHPALTLEKPMPSNADEDASGDVTLNDTLTYEFVATNTGDVTLSGVTITDPLAGLGALSCTPAQPASLTPEAAMTCTASYSVSQAPQG